MLTNPDSQSETIARLAREELRQAVEIRGTLAPLAIERLRDILNQSLPSSDRVMVDAARAVLAMAGHTPPAPASRTASPAGAGLATRTTDELRDALALVEGELSARAKPVA